jgi:hypothetical protein
VAALTAVFPGKSLLQDVNLPTALAAAALVLAVILVIKIGKVLLLSAMFGAMAAGVSVGQGSRPAEAGVHAAIAFGVAAVTLFLIKMTRSLLLWLVITGAGVVALFVADGLRR